MGGTATGMSSTFGGVPMSQWGAGPTDASPGGGGQQGAGGQWVTPFNGPPRWIPIPPSGPVPGTQGGPSDISMGGGGGRTDLPGGGYSPAGGGQTDLTGGMQTQSSGGYGMQMPGGGGPTDMNPSGMGTYGLGGGGKGGPMGGGGPTDMNPMGGGTTQWQNGAPLPAGVAGTGGTDMQGNPLQFFGAGGGNMQGADQYNMGSPYQSLPGANLGPAGFQYDAANPMAFLQQKYGAGTDLSNPQSVQQAIAAQHATFDAQGNPVPSRFHSHATPQNIEEIKQRWANTDRGLGPWAMANKPANVDMLAMMNALNPGFLQQNPNSTQYKVLTGQIDPQKFYQQPQKLDLFKGLQGVGTWMPMPGNWGGFQPGITPGQYFGGAGGSTPSGAAISASLGNAGVAPWW